MGIINWLIGCIRHIIYTVGEYWTRKTMEEDNMMETEDNMTVVNNISEFYDKWFAAHQVFVNDDTGYEIKLVKNDVEYFKIMAHRVPEQCRQYIQVLLYKPIDFNVTPDEFNKLLYMLSVIYNWEDRPLDRCVTQFFTPLIDFLKKSSEHLLGEDYRQLFNSYYDDIKAIDENDLRRDDIVRWLKALTEAWDMLTDNLASEQPEEAEEDTEMKDLSTDKGRVFNNVLEFTTQFYKDQFDFIHNGTSFKTMLFSNNKSVKYISIAGYNGDQINVRFHETPAAIELKDVMNIVRIMRTLLKTSYSGGEYGVDFNYMSYPEDMLSYIKELVGHTPVQYKECYDKFKELEQDEDKYLYELYERAYFFLGKWLDYAENWVLRRQDQPSDNYYADGNGQDMFAKFEGLDDFREQTYALGFCYHNIEKYLVRAGRKTDDPTEDINKALDYLHEYRKLQKIYFE